jgi:hypothetical protein
VADFGKGIPTLVRSIHPEMNDNQAIIKSVEEGFTTKSTPGNYGIGLDYMLRVVVRTNGGRVTIHSLGGHVLFTKSRNNAKPTVLNVNGWCPGTTIDIVFRTDAIVHEPDEAEDLQW